MKQLDGFVKGDDCQDDDFSGLTQKILDNLETFKDDQLWRILINLEQLQKSPRSTSEAFQENIDELLAELDEICCERGRVWSQSELMKMSNVWFKLNYYSNFIEGALGRVRRGFIKLPKEIFIETLFYLTSCRRNIPLTFVEVRLKAMFDELTANELGIFCMSLYKNDVWIKDEDLVHKLYEKTFAEIDRIDEVTLQYFLKQLRISSEALHLGHLKKLCELLLKRINGYSLKTCVHIGLLGTNSEYCHQELIEAVVRRFNADIDQAIVRNFADLALIISHFNFKTDSGIEKELIAKIMTELKRRVDEVVKIPRALAVAMNNLTICGVHDEEIIEAVLTEKFCKLAYGEENFKRRDLQMNSIQLFS
jgi:CxxC motif-containing protein